MATHNETGKKGELLALDWLSRKGFNILDHNWRYSRYELDVVASRGEFLHFVEVKTRTNRRFGFPEEAVSDKKIESLMRAAAVYIERHPGWKRIQYNILSIYLEPGMDPDYFFIEDIYC